MLDQTSIEGLMQVLQNNKQTKEFTKSFGSVLNFIVDPNNNFEYDFDE